MYLCNEFQAIKRKCDILRAVGAEVIVCPTDVKPTDPRSYYSVSKRLAKETENGWYVNQYDNLQQSCSLRIYSSGNLGTDRRKAYPLCGRSRNGGTITGCGTFFKEKNKDIKVIGVDTYGSILKEFHETGELHYDHAYTYITEGIGEDIIPENYDMSVIDHFEKVTDKDGAIYARKLAKEEGIFCGYSAGSAIASLIQMKDQFTKDDVIVVLLHDHGSRYVGKIYNDEWMKEMGWLEENKEN